MGAIIKEKLKEIMMNSIDDCGSMSSVYIRELLERELKRKLDDFKKFIDATIFLCYNQLVEKATQILPFLFLGTEWNASNYDALINDKVTHILNVSNEVDNFFPDAFKYLNVRIRDSEDTDLLKEFDRTNRFIQEAKDQGTSCLVHCKMGVSRSASVVLAYLMKEFDYCYSEAFQFAKQKRACIKPNDGFKHQLLTYESILNAHKAKKTIFEPQPTSPLQPTLNNSVSNEVNSEFKLTSSELNLTQTRTVRDVVNKINIGRFANDSNSNNLTSSLTTPSSSQVGSLLNTPQINSCSTSPKTLRNSAIKSEKSDENKPAVPYTINPTRVSSQVTDHDVTKKPETNYEKDVKTPSNNRHFRSKSISEISNVNELTKIESCRQQERLNMEDVNSNYVPIGTVKRQVESINIKSRPFSMQSIENQCDQENFKRQTRNSLCETYDLGSDKKYFQNSEDLKYLPSLVIFNSLTKSPDSKRFKSNQLKYNSSSSDSTVAVLSKSFEFSRSKKVFEQLQSKQIKTYSGETKS
jgi:protein-tyrosine phosphatase